MDNMINMAQVTQVSGVGARIEMMQGFVQTYQDGTENHPVLFWTSPGLYFLYANSFEGFAKAYNDGDVIGMSKHGFTIAYTTASIIIPELAVRGYFLTATESAEVAAISRANVANGENIISPAPSSGVQVTSSLNINEFETGQGFSGVMNTQTKEIAMAPSNRGATTINLKNGTPYSGTVVEQSGGHATVRYNAGFVSGETAGFSVIKTGESCFEVRWNSGQNTTTYGLPGGERSVPLDVRPIILEQLRKKYPNFTFTSAN
jgi:hypothetical protein